MNKLLIAFVLWVGLTANFIPEPEIPVFKPVQAEKPKKVDKPKPKPKKAEKPLKTVNKPKPAPALKALATNCSDVRQLLKKHGITGAELEAAVMLANVESTCNINAVNPYSGACNIFQELPCGKWGGTYDVDAHIVGAIGRINSTYKGSWQYAIEVWSSRSPHWW